MNHVWLNEHDANQGAQSTGEFLGMAGNTAWYLLGAIAVTQALIVFLWGMLGVPLTVCLGAGGMLCLLALAYVFGLKNDKPAHYDTDFFESVLIEAGVLPLAFGPNGQRPPKPFRSERGAAAPSAPSAGRDKPVCPLSRAATPSGATPAYSTVPDISRPAGKPPRAQDEIPTVPLGAYERLQQELNDTSEQLEDALAEREEDHVCA